ncbi:MAG: glycosyltransferase [Candidatus Omnitrophica bacterium]|nr:glycosyltransferase [Candidatus Omnitrophota bacterium]MDD5652650.1 glycosyltransferase [Candidatus Omnitrophota bacterium]
MKISIIVPAYNEEENIAEVIRRVEETVNLEHELVVVNDHSRDKTAQIISALKQKYPNLRPAENKLDAGFANAIKSGFSQAQGEVVVPVMGDLCDELSTIKEMLKKIEEGFDVVCGCRYIKGGARIGGSRLKGFLSASAGWSLYYLLGVPTHDIANAFKMYRKNVIDNIKIEAKGFEISMEIPLKAFYQGFKIAEVPTTWREREKGKSSFKIFKLIPVYLGLYFWAIRRRIMRTARS